jgi:hypothetical protein
MGPDASPVAVAPTLLLLLPLPPLLPPPLLLPPLLPLLPLLPPLPLPLLPLPAPLLAPPSAAPPGLAPPLPEHEAIQSSTSKSGRRALVTVTSSVPPV